MAEEIYDAGTITEAVKNLPLDAALIKKMSEEIERQLAKTNDYPGCEVYFLEVVRPDLYPVLGYGNAVIGYVNLDVGNVWKVGMTSNGQKGRYSTDTFYKNPMEGIYLTGRQLQYQYILKGTYKQCIILEKLLIYTYSMWSGYPELVKPPGCRIFR